MVFNEESIKKEIKNKFEDESLHKKQREALEKFNKRCKADGLSLNTRRNYIQHVSNFGKHFNKPFDEISKDDITEYLAKRRDEVKESSISQTKISIKKFYKYLCGKEEYPEKVSWIDATYKNNNRLKSKDLITREELEEMVSVCDNYRDKALLCVLYDGGLRKGELISLDVDNVSFDEYGAKINIEDSKTLPREIRVLNSSVVALKNWLNNHKDKNKHNAPLFYSFSSYSYGERLECISDILKKISKRAEIDKNIYPHLFRHSRATEVAKEGYNESFMRAFFGWDKNSNMPSTYIHLAEQDLDDTMLKKEGLIDENNEEDKKSISEPIVCPNCSTKNLPSNLYCKNCATKLKDDSDDKIKETMGKLMSLMLDDEKIRNRLEEKRNDGQWQDLAKKLSKNLNK